MKNLLCLSLLLPWLSPHVLTADELPKELASVRRALIVDLNDGLKNKAESVRLDRQKDMTQLEDVLQTRCGLRVTRINSENAEDSAVNWVNASRSEQEVDQYFVIYLRGALAMHPDEGIPDEGIRVERAGDAQNGSFALANVLHAFQNHSPKAKVLVVLEHETPLAAKELESALRQTLKRAEVTQPQLACFAIPHNEKALGNQRATRCFVESLGWSESTLTTSNAKDIGLSLTNLGTLLSERIPAPGSVVLAMNDSTRPASFLLPVAPCRVSELMECIARQLATQLKREGVQLVGLLPFVVESSRASAADIPGEDCGTLSRICRSQLLGHLQAKSLGKFAVANDEEMLKALYQCQIVPENVLSDVPHERFPQLEDQLRANDKELSTALVWISFKLEGSAKLSFRSGLYSQKPHKFQAIRETAVLTPQDAPALGGNGGLKSSLIQAVSTDSAPLVQSINLHSPQGRCQNEDAVKAQQVLVHQLSDDQFPFRISLVVNGKSESVLFTDDKSVAYTPLKPRDKITIRVENRSRVPVFMRLTVDGKNTLPDRDGETGQFVPQKFVDWRKARPWYLEPASENGQPRVYQIRGFFSQIAGDQRRAQNAPQQANAPQFAPDDADVDLFEVGQPKYIEELPRGFRDQAGMLTVAFYQPVPLAVAQGDGQFLPIIKGPTVKEKIQVFQGQVTPAEVPLCFYSLRYGFAPPR